MNQNNYKQNRVIELLKKAEAAYDKNNYLFASELYGELYSYDRKNNFDFLQKMILSSLGNKSLVSNELIYNISSFIKNLSLYVKALILKINILKNKSSNNQNDDNIYSYYNILETIIRNNPNSKFALLNLSTIYESNNLKKNAAILLETYIRTNKNDTNILKNIGNIYIDINDIEKARSMFKKVLEIKSFDQEAEKKLRDLLAISSIDESKLRGDDYNESIKDKNASYKAQLELKVMKTKEEVLYLINEKKKEIENNKKKVPLYMDLLQYYRELNDKQNISYTLNMIAELSPSDINILIEACEASIELYKENLKQNDSDNDLEIKLNTFKKEQYLKIENNFPANVDIKFKLAEILFELNDNDESLKLFQLCTKSPELNVISKNYMGKLFLRKKMFDMAIDQFKSGISMLDEMNELKKDMIYNLALIYDDMKKHDLAIEQYKLIYKEDVSYKDISQRIETAYKND